MSATRSDGILWSVGKDNVTVWYNESKFHSMARGVFIHPHWEKFEPLSKTFHLICGSFATIVAFIAILGNCLVISLFLRYRSLRNSSNFLVLNLSVADLIMALGNLPVYAISSFSNAWLFADIGCQIYGFFGSLGSLVSMNTLTMISLERSIVIADKIPWSRRSSNKTMIAVIIFTWLYSGTWAVAPLLGWGRYILEGSLTSCTFDFLSQTMAYKSFVIGLLIFCFYIQVSIIFFSYLFIFLKVALHERELNNLNNRKEIDPFCLRVSKSRRKEKRELKIAKVALGVVLAFCAAWLPYATIAMIACFGDSSKINIVAVSIASICAKCCTAINPLIYALSHPKYKRKLVKNLFSMWSCRSKSRSTSGSIESNVTQKNRFEFLTKPKSKSSSFSEDLGQSVL